MSESTTSNHTNEELLVLVNDEAATTLIPAMLFVGILMVTAFFGNLLVCFIFSTRMKSGTQNFMIVCLAVFDLLACVIAMPTEIVDMRYYYMFDSTFACKLFRFVNVLCAMCSILTLTAIAIDRYIKVCRPLGRQMALREAKLSVFGAILIGVLLSWPAVFIYGRRTADTGIPGVVGRDCSTSDEMKSTFYPLLYNCILFLGFIGLTIAFIAIYSKIYRQVKKHKKYMNKIAISTPSSPIVSTTTTEFNFSTAITSVISDSSSDEAQKVSAVSLQQLYSPNLSPNNGSIFPLTNNTPVVTFKNDSSPDSKCSVDMVYVPYNSLLESSDNSNNVKVIPPPLHIPVPTFRNVHQSGFETNMAACSTPRKKKRLELGRENKTTVIACFVTIVFVLSYLPYLGLVFAAIFNKDFDHDLRGASLTAFNLFLRSYFVNSAVNPIIYGVLNYRFRLEVKALFKRLQIWKKKS